MKNRKMWIGMLVIVLVFGMMVVGCNDDDEQIDEQIIDPRYHGKWELESIVYSDGYILTLPVKLYDDGGTEYREWESEGHEFNEKSIKRYSNGFHVGTIVGAYTMGNDLILPNGVVAGTMIVSGNKLTITSPDQHQTEHYIRVLRFSWE